MLQGRLPRLCPPQELGAKASPTQGHEFEGHSSLHLVLRPASRMESHLTALTSKKILKSEKKWRASHCIDEIDALEHFGTAVRT